MNTISKTVFLRPSYKKFWANYEMNTQKVNKLYYTSRLHTWLKIQIVYAKSNLRLKLYILLVLSKYDSRKFLARFSYLASFYCIIYTENCRIFIFFTHIRFIIRDEFSRSLEANKIIILEEILEINWWSFFRIEINLRLRG